MGLLYGLILSSHIKGEQCMTEKKPTRTIEVLIDEWIEKNEKLIIQFLQELLYIPSENPPGNTYDIAEFLTRRLKELGLANTQLLKVDKTAANHVGVESAQNVLTVQNFGTDSSPEIVLNAYGDTVPPGVGWMYDPYDAEIVDGSVYGRGAALAKSDIAAYTFSVLALKELAKTDLRGRIRLAFTFDGESGGFLGPKWLLDQKFIDPDMAITPGFTHSILNAHNGCLQLRVTLTGRGTHGSLHDSGSDAVEAMQYVLGILYEYRESLKKKSSIVRGLDSPTLTIGLIEGGTSISVVPDRCSISLDRRFIPEEDGLKVEEELYELIHEATQGLSNISCDIERILYAPTFGPTSQDTQLLKTLGRQWQKVFPKNELKIGGIPLYADARHFSERGIPTVMFGAGPSTLEEARGYQADEHIKIDDLLKAVKIISLTLYELLLEQTM